MSAPFISHPATTKSTFQHPCRTLFATASLVAGPFFSNQAQAALNCNSQPTCGELGYSKTVAADCPSDEILLCPFDKSFKKCVALATPQEKSCSELGFTTTDKSKWCLDILTCSSDNAYTACLDIDHCDNYTLPACPTGAASCTACGIGTDVKYQLNGCKNGYILSTDTCVANSCSGYTQTSCSTGAICDSCQSGESILFKTTGCQSGYSLKNGICGRFTCEDYGYVSTDPSKDCNICPSAGVVNSDGDSLHCFNDNSCSIDADCEYLTKCNGYTYPSCPAEAGCDSCTNLSTTKYKITSCKKAYNLINGKCYQKSCDDIGWLTSTSCDTCTLDSFTYEGVNFNCFAASCSTNCDLGGGGTTDPSLLTEAQCRAKYGYDECAGCRLCDCNTPNFGADTECAKYGIQDCRCASW